MTAAVVAPIEQQIRQERDRFLAFAFCGNDMLIELDAEGRIHFAAGATELLTGNSGRGLIGRAFIDLVSAEHRATVGAAITASVQAGKRFDDVAFQLIPPGRAPIAVESTGFSASQFQGHCFMAVRRVKPPRAVALAALRPAIPEADAALQVRRIIEASAFDVAFQPVVSLATAAYHHMEALLRLRPESAGGLTTAAFVRQAETNGLIAELDLAVAKETVRRIIEVADKGRPLSVAINVSGRSLETPGFTQRLCQVFSVRRALSQLMIVEITDSGAIENLAAANDFIRSIRTEGFRVTLDDFGARGAAFEQLRRLEVDFVKIDGSFIAESRKDERAKALVLAMTGLCRALGVIAIAEQVEDPATIDFLSECGVGYGQGYFFGRPISDPDLLVGESMSKQRWRRSGVEINSFNSVGRGG